MDPHTAQAASRAAHAALATWLHIGEVAFILQVTILTLRRWDKSGKLPAYRHPLTKRRIYPSWMIFGLIEQMHAEQWKRCALERMEKTSQGHVWNRPQPIKRPYATFEVGFT